MQRLLTGLLAGGAFLAGVFLLSGLGFFIFCAVAVTGAAVEFSTLARRWVPGAPVKALWVLAPAAGYALFSGLPVGAALAPAPAPAISGVVLAAALLVAAASILTLMVRTPIQEGLPAMAILAFATVYFAVPMAGAALLRDLDPWLLILCALVVTLGDTAALVFGKRLGRHKMSPVVSPNKSWEGSIASLLAGILVGAAWSQLRLGWVDPAVLALCAGTSVLAQLGDLVESLVKRGAGVKDSGFLLPGHGGLYDRLDALLFGIPAFMLGVWWLGPERLMP